MQNRKASIASSLVVLMSVVISPRIANATQSDTPAPQGVPVHVADFELSAAPAGVLERSSADEKERSEKDLQLRSREIQNCFAEALVEALRKKEYPASRKQDPPGKGIMLEGVFAEPDEKNRIRPARLGSNSPGTKLLLYIGVFNQKSINQPLYKEAPVEEADPNYGPVITLNAYVPMAKYEIAKDLVEEDIRRICGQIAADLTVLLQRNPAWLAQAQ